MTLTSYDLLYKVLDLLCYKKNDKKYYDSKQLKGEPPSYYRLLQIEALMEAFGLSKKHYNSLSTVTQRLVDKAEYDRRTHLNSLTNLEYLLRGEFFNDKNIDTEYSGLKEKISQNARQHVQGLGQHYYDRPLNLPWLFNLLMDYRIDLHQFTKKPTGFMEGFDISIFYGHCMQADIAETLSSSVKSIDKLLIYLLDPKGKSYTIAELVSTYNYPDVDLQQIDSDWLMENY